MVYLFERDNEAIHLEARYSESSRLFEIIWRASIHDDLTRETFSGEIGFRERLDEIKEQLEKASWHHAGPPDLLDGGWKV